MKLNQSKNFQIKTRRNKGFTLVELLLVLVILMIVAVSGGCATAPTKGPAETIAEGCRMEIDAHCKNVTQGGFRVLACLYAYSDRLSARCEYSLYDAASQLERAVNALAFTANECRDDLKTYCSEVKPGEGRLFQCLDKNKDKISGRCNQALKDVGAK